MTLKSKLLKWLELQDQNDFEYLENLDLSKYTTLGLKSSGDILKVKNEKFISNLFKEFSGKSFVPIGKGANVILGDSTDKIFIKLNLLDTVDELNEIRESYYLSASTNLSKIITHASTYNLKGWEVLAGIPGTLGGAVFMNAGTRLGEISSILNSVRIVRSCGKIENIQIDQNSFGYRVNHIIYPGDLVSYACLKNNGVDKGVSEAIKKYINYRKSSQPLSKRTCGSVFKNDFNYLAGKSIDLAGLKSFGVSSLQVSAMHANFIENNDGAKQTDFVRLTDALKQELELTYGIKFELEAKFL